MAWTEEQRVRAREGKARVREEKRAQAKREASAQRPGAAVPGTPPASEAEGVGDVRGGRVGLLPSQAELETIEKMAQVFVRAGVAKRLTADQAVALILLGRDAGIPPGQAIQGLYIEDGTPAMNAVLMRARIEASGLGHLDPVESGRERVVMKAVRYGVAGRPDREYTTTWDKARAGGLWGSSPSWVNDPESMLFARATTELGRRHFPDVLAGINYDPEELRASRGVTSERPGGPAASPPPPPPTPVPPPSRPVQRGAGPAEGGRAPGRPAQPSAAPPPSPAPSPAPPVAPAPPPAQPEAVLERPRTTSVQIEEPGGGVRVVMTAGVTKPQIRELARFTAPSGGHPRHAELRAAAQAFLREKSGVGQLVDVTEEEAGALLVHLKGLAGDGVGNGGGAAASPPAAGPSTQVLAWADYNAVVTQFALTAYADELAQMVCDTLGVDSLNHLTPAQLHGAAAQVRDWAQDPAALKIMLDRLRLTAGAP